MANLEEIYQAGIRALNKVSKPHLQFEIGDLADFLQIAEYEDLSNALQLGTYTVIEHTGLRFYDRVLQTIRTNLTVILYLCGSVTR